MALSRVAPGFLTWTGEKHRAASSKAKSEEVSSLDVAKWLFRLTLVTVVISSTFVAGIYSAIHKNLAYQFVGNLQGAVKSSLSAISETSVFVPKQFLQPSRKEGDGVTINTRENDDSLILLSGFFDGGNELRLIRRDGSIVRRWPVRFSEIFPDPRHMEHPPATDWNIDIHGALLLADGSVVFNFEYGGLVKLDRCGGVVWALAHETHHSVELAESGGFWVPGQRAVSGGRSDFPPFVTPYKEDLILKVKEDGAIDYAISVPGLLYENGLSPLLTATGESFERTMQWDHEIVHLNKVAELKTDRADHFSVFEAGDLLISLREHNLLLVIDPIQRKVKWWKIGPWVRQHDPEFDLDGTITVFNNNAYRSSLLDGDRSDLEAPRNTNILRVDPSTDQWAIAYGGQPEQELMSVIRGKHDPMDDGAFLITEFEAGRVLETDSQQRIVWEFINRYDRDNVAELTEARAYRRDYFQVTDWSCEHDRGN